jgi:3(or 17)beta-hydroxysteroid dehydrogenase
MNRLDGKVALLSGAARGIGAETARKMAAAGASVVIGDVLADRAHETAKEINDAGGKALSLTLDVTMGASWTAAAMGATRSLHRCTPPMTHCPNR